MEQQSDHTSLGRMQDYNGVGTKKLSLPASSLAGSISLESRIEDAVAQLQKMRAGKSEIPNKLSKPSKASKPSKPSKPSSLEDSNITTLKRIE